MLQSDPDKSNNTKLMVKKLSRIKKEREEKNDRKHESIILWILRTSQSCKYRKHREAAEKWNSIAVENLSSTSFQFMSLAFHTMIFFKKCNSFFCAKPRNNTERIDAGTFVLFWKRRKPQENSLGSGLAIHIATGELFNKREFLSHFTYYLTSKRYWTQGGSVQYNLSN